MKLRWLYSIITAIALMISAPVVMACGSCHVDTGALGYQTVNVIDVGKVDPTDKLISTTNINANSTETMTTSGVNVPIMAYSEPRKLSKHGIKRVTKCGGYAKPNNDGRYPYAGVTAA